ncbi:unnamed protein product [Notodromas monacha]|uniref:J domain-containing protein n=1 Tax=Notodromas monacha TaxID=399045 RepID=A0A7R9BMG3_9CRUS|nr:unnamed protein product [Notodromas monacha]CAG0917307.1 unnamed protein product [Notodromas monacha]
MDAILNFDVKDLEDFYDVLGCAPDSSLEQILAEYKIRARELHPDKNAGKAAKEKFQKLQEAKDVLSDPERRDNYDKWKSSGLAIPFKEWYAMKRKTHSGMHWAPAKLQKGMIEPAKEEADEFAVKNEVNITWTRDERSRKFQSYMF